MYAARHNCGRSLLALVLGAALALACRAQSPTLAKSGQTWGTATGPAAPSPQNPYNLQLAGLVGGLQRAPSPEAAVLLHRIYELRDYVDEPAEVERTLAGVASDGARHALVRDEALRLLALIDVHEHRLAAARMKLAQLGFVRQWAVVGPFATSQGLDARLGPEAGFSATAEYPDSSRRRRWRAVPDFGPHAWINLSDFYPQAGPAVAFAATSLFAEAPRTVALRFGASSAVALFVNGRQVFRGDSDTGIGFDQYAVAVPLRAGWNSVLMKFYRAEQGAWEFGLRVSELSGGGRQLRAAATPAPSSPAPSAVPHPPEDLVQMAERAAATEPSAANLETLGRIEREHARGPWLEHFQAAAQREPTATRWLLVARSCDEPACKFAALNAAVRTEPQDVAAQLALADYYFGRQHLEAARDLLRTAAARAPENFVVREHLAAVYVSAGMNTLALQEFRRLEAEFPEPLWLRRQLAGRYADFGLLDQAQALLEAALAHNWDGAEERALLRRIYERQHDAERLRAMYSEDAELEPTSRLPWARWAQLAAGAGDAAAAEAKLRAALELAPEDDGLHRQFAELLASAGKSEEARQELARALAINPQLSDARRRLEALGGGRENDPEAAFLADVSQLSEEARRLPPPAVANSVALADVRIERVYDNGLSAVRVQQVFYVVNEQGARDLATRSVQYTPDSQQLEILRARVHKPGGRTVEAEDEGESNVAEPGAAMFYDVRARRLRFRGLEPGDVLELDYRVTPSTRTNAYGDYFGDLVVFGGSQPEKLRRFVLITPERRRFNVLEERMPSPATVSTRDGQRTFVWEAHDLPALPNEPRAPALTEIAPYVNVSTLASWADLGRWYAQLIQPQLALDAALREALAGVVAGKQTAAEKIRAIHEFVLRNTHYVALEFGIYGYKPYPVSQIYARRFGDCKDKASVMIALLRAAGIDADIALVRTRRLGDISERAASISIFNHAVAYLPQYDLWLDGTAEYAGSRELPLEDQGAMALTVAADGSAQLRRIPVTTAEQNYTRRTVQARIGPNGVIHFSGSAYIRGEDAPGLRREYEVAERQRDAFRDHLAEIFPSVRVEDVQVDGANDLEQDITVNFRGALDTFRGRQALSLAASWMPRSYVQTLAPLASREEPLLLPAPWTTEEEIHFALPAGATVQSLPGNTLLETPFGSAALRFEQRGREVVIRTSVQFRKVRISTAEYAAFRDFCDQIERAFRGEVKVGL
jgi:transglutaminase-like putative cysteine protease/Tfp pilus assembly protein PilF